MLRGLTSRNEQLFRMIMSPRQIPAPGRPDGGSAPGDLRSRGQQPHNTRHEETMKTNCVAMGHQNKNGGVTAEEEAVRGDHIRVRGGGGS